MNYEYGIHPNGLINYGGGSSWKKCSVDYSPVAEMKIVSIAITTRMQSKSKQPRMVTVKKTYDIDGINSKEWWLL